MQLRSGDDEQPEEPLARGTTLPASGTRLQGCRPAPRGIEQQYTERNGGRTTSSTSSCGRAGHPADVGPASVLLTRAFAGSLQGIPIQDARQYCLDSLKQVPRGVLLVARLQPDDPALLPPGQASRVVATTGLSFCRATREDFPTLQPPDEAVYLSNMAVDGKLRRYGFARLMLAAAEGLAAAQGGRQLYLHARLADAPAQQLYLSSGYAVVGRDGFLAKLRGITPRALMVKPLQ
ncbi:acyl-N-acyltransferase [Micractinium conductrix]|uniref:Acyl-N-acyltransferase n=1 Tax=Micractinium conductrix TaxID=554055 RepID=A0A2P6VNI7_9CHLO|nr:acyl-N-acyltransferase [Micractinium conductrix]|eukprot:PSC75660.1 acyl-N-acyltransferase [Micractinium conductrix]